MTELQITHIGVGDTAIEVVATERVDCVRLSGQRLLVEISVGKPRCGAPHWSCPVVFSGIFDGVHVIEGADSFQALCLSLMFIQRVLTGFVKNGGRVLYVETDDDFPLNPYFQHGPV